MVFVLLLLFQIKHFVADYPLQSPYMLGKFKAEGWVGPLSAHCGVHALMTFSIGIYFGFWIALCVACFDFVIHFIMDRIKASPKMLGRYESLSKGEFKGLMDSRALCLDGIKYEGSEPLNEESFRRLKEIDQRFKGNKHFWWALGLDQMIHHLTHYAIIFAMVYSS